MEKELIKKMGRFSAYIEYDQDAQSPEEWGDKSLFLVSFHRDFSVDGICETIPEHLREVTHKSYCTECYQRNFTTIEETGKKCGKCGKQTRVNKTYYKTSKGRPMFDKDDCIAIAEAGMKHKDYHVFGLEAYIHSGVSLSLVNEGNFPDRQWDVSYVGMVFASKEEFKSKDEARTHAKELIEEWNIYLSGDVWNVIIEDEDGEYVESCGGFYGMDYAKEEALRMLKSAYDHDKKNPKPIDYSTFTLGALVSHEDETIKRNAMSILKRLPKIKAEQEATKKFMRAQKKLPFPKKK